MYKRSVGIAILLSACANLDYEPRAAWQAQVLPVGAEDVSATAAVAYEGGRSFQAGIELRGNPSTTYGWEVAAGSCAAPGPRLGGLAAYPDVTTGPGGVGAVERTFANERLSPQGRYHARIVDPQSRTTVLACGDLLRVDAA